LVGKTTVQSSHFRPRLIVFDVEGVLIPKNRYLLFEASRRLSFVNFFKMLLIGLLYEAGLMSLEATLRKIYGQLYGLSVEDLFQLYRKIPLILGVGEVFRKLKKEGYKTAIISSGLPQPFVEHLANELGADHAVGLNIDVINGCLTGQISGDVIKPNGKALALEKILEKEELTAQECALVADDRNNLPMFKLCTLKIGYNPDFMLTAKSDVVVKGDFGEVLSLINEPTTFKGEMKAVSKRDIIRETIHIGGFLVPVVSMYLALNPFLVAFLIFLVTSFYVISELARMLGYNFPVTSTITWNAAILPEIYEFVTSPIFFAVGIMLALVIFPASVAYASIAIFTLGDSFATLFGKKFGRHAFPYNKGKKIEGSIVGLLFAWFGASFFVNPWASLVGAVVGMFVETLPLPLSDNLTIPLISGLTLLTLP